MFFTFLITYMIMNIFVAVILEAYEESSLDESAVVKEDDLHTFNAEWAEVDPEASMTIPLSVLPQLMDALPHPMGFRAANKKKNAVVIRDMGNFEESKRCLLFPPDLDEHEKAEVRATPTLSQSEKQQAIDEMDVHSYEENGDAQVRFRDILFACVQRAYKHDQPALPFRIDVRHQDVLRDETKTMSAVPIKTSHYLSALRIAQAYRAHKFRNNFIGMQKKEDDSSEEKYSDPDNRDTREAFADEGPH